MSDQQTNFLHKLLDEDSICRSMLNLSTISDHQSSSATAASGSPDPFPTTCVCSAKRQFPLSRSLVQEPSPKRATLNPPSSPSAAAEADDRDLFGYKKLQLPPGYISASPTPLRRTLSEPIYSPGTFHSAAPPQLPELSISPPPIKTRPCQEVCNANASQETYPLMYRTLSDPIPDLNRPVVAAAGTPPRPPSIRNFSRSPRFGESPNARRLRRMKEQLREMSQWANQVSNADDGEETVESNNHSIDNDPKLQEEPENLPQEAVFVKKSGNGLVLHFRCPCGNGYQILLSGNSCYYKLTSFLQS